MRDDEIYELYEQKFEWSRMKAAKNVIHHGVRFTEAASVFFDPEAMFELDDEHSEEEQRYTIVGRSIRSRAIFVVHVTRGEKIRIISARPAEPHERREYEAQLGR